MNILVDRHHAGLLNSSQLLFEDRLGLNLYIPVGLDWWGAEIWNFGRSTYADDRLARQFLSLNDAELVVEPGGAIPARDAEPHESGAYYVLRDQAEYPEREIRCVTLEQFKELGDWAYVMPSVPDNLAGYAALAKACGAQLLYQVGNRGQQIDWSHDPIVLSSSEQPITGRGVVYHQEYPKDTTFRYRAPEGRRLVGSFLNCFEKAHTPTWEYFQAVRAEASDFGYTIHGSDGPDGKLGPLARIADRMAECDFIYHDKPSGDGFGHVIHYAASVGRPLIGTAAYYTGLMAGALWEDGVTAIDTGGRHPHEVAERMRSIACCPEEHEAMCLAIRHRVDQLVDFDAEETQIRALLGI